MPETLPNQKLRLLNLGWSLLLLAMTILLIKGIQIYSKDGKLFPDSTLIFKLVILFFILAFLLNTVKGTIKPAWGDVPTLRLLGWVMRFSGLFAPLILLVHTFTDQIDSSWLVVSLSSAGFLLIAWFSQITWTSTKKPGTKTPFDQNR